MVGLLLALLSGSGLTGDPDLFWHLQIGRQWLSGADLTTDVFSYTFAGAKVGHMDLLAEVILYAGFSRLGYAWLLLLKALCAGTILIAYTLALPPKQRHPMLGLLSGGGILCIELLVERPNLFSMALMPLQLALIERARRGAATTSPAALARLFGPLLVLQVGWAALHRASMFGHLLLGLLALYLLCVHATARQPRLSRALGPHASRSATVAAALTAAVALFVQRFVLPGGAAALRTAFAYRAGGEAGWQRRYISEFLRLGPRELVSAFPATAALAALALVLVAYHLIRSLVRTNVEADGDEPERPLDAWHAGLLVMTLGLSLDSVRWVPYLTRVAMLLGVLSLGAGLPWLGARMIGGARPHRPAGWLGSLLGPLSGVILLLILYLRHPSPLMLGPDPERVPLGAFAFAKQNRLRGSVVNAFELGGYTIFYLWPDVRVMVDGRNDTLYPPSFMMRALDSDRDPRLFAQMRKEDGVTWVLAVNRPNYQSHAYLAHDPAWAAVYWSDTAIIYVERRHHPLLMAQSFQLLDPSAVDRSVVDRLQRQGGDERLVAQVGDELLRMLQESPESLRANVALLLFYHLRGPAHWAERDRVRDRLLQLAPDHPAVREVLRRLGR